MYDMSYVWEEKDRSQDHERAESANEIFRALMKKKGYTEIDPDKREDTDRQLQGIDVIMKSANGQTMYIDEKSATSAWNRDLRTFSIEISSNNNQTGGGWLYNPNSKTTHYAFIYPRAKDETMKEITSLDAYIVPKEALLNYLAKNYITCRRDAEEILKYDGYEFAGKLRAKSREVEVVQSLDLREQPINVLVSRDILRSLSVDRCKMEYTKKMEPRDFAKIMSEDRPRNNEEKDGQGKKKPDQFAL